MNLPFDISPLNPDNVVSYEIADEDGYKVVYIIYKDEQSPFIPKDWNVRLVLSKQDMSQEAKLRDSRYKSPDTQSRECAGATRSVASAEGETQGKPKLTLRYYEKINAKDKLVSIGGRACLVLGTAEAAVDTEKLNLHIHSYVLFAFYDFYQNAASVKFNILQFFYYDTSTGRMFVDSKLNELNKLLWTETTKHNFAVVPEWNVARICEIYMNRSV